MNERIKELAEQAGLKYHNWITNESNIDDGDFKYPRLEDYEKFAELIITECMNQVREQYLPVMEDELMMKDTHWDGYVQCGVDSYVAIREHFGVEQ